MPLTLKKLKKPFRKGAATTICESYTLHVTKNKDQLKVCSNFTSSDKKNTYKAAIQLNKRSKAGWKLDNSTCKVSCECNDFIYTFATANEENEALLGKRPKIKPLKGTGKPRNPGKIPGMCKHLQVLAASLYSIVHLEED